MMGLPDTPFSRPRPELHGPPSRRALSFLGLRFSRMVEFATRTNRPSQAQDAVTSDSRRAIRDSSLNALPVVTLALRAKREALPLALSGIFKQGNCQTATREIVLSCAHGTAGDGDDRQGNWAGAGDCTGLSASGVVLHSIEQIEQ